MNLAEALLLKKDIKGAVAALNQTRQTHGGLSASDATTEEEAWKDYMRERRVEMAYENGDIYYSYLRWGKYGGVCQYIKSKRRGGGGGGSRWGGSHLPQKKKQTVPTYT